MPSHASVTRDETADEDDSRGAENILEFCRNFFNSVNVTPASHQSDELLIGGVDGDADTQQVTYKLPPNCEEMLGMFNITNSSNNMASFDDYHNNSNNSQTDMNDNDSAFEQTDYEKVAVLSAIILLTIIGNFSVVISILMRRTKVTRMYFFILHLSIADILTAFFTLLPEFAWTFTFPKFYGGNVVCKGVKVLQIVGPYLSSYTLVMTAVDRYHAICYPLSNHRWTIHKSHTMLGIAWIVSLLFSAPQASVFHAKTINYCRAEFAPGWGAKAYVLWYATSNFFVPFVVLIFCYGKMCSVLWSNFKQKKQQQQAQMTTTPNTAAAGNATQNDSYKSPASANKIIKTGKQNNFNNMRISFRRCDVLLEESSCEVAAIDCVEPSDSIVTPLSGGSASVNVTPSNSKKNGTGKVVKRSSQKSKKKLCKNNPDLIQEVVEQTRPRLPSSSSSHKSDCKTNGAVVEQAPVQNPKNNVACPRSHSIRSISNAKIKTVKLTIVVVVGYLVCSAPFVCVQLYTVFGTPSSSMLKSMTWLFWLQTLNSCLNPWIYMAFNPELIHILIGRRRNCDRGSLFRRQGTTLVRLRRSASGLTTRASGRAMGRDQRGPGFSPGGFQRDSPTVRASIIGNPVESMIMEESEANTMMLPATCSTQPDNPKCGQVTC